MKLIASFRTPALWLPVAFPNCSHPNLTLLFCVPTTCPEFFKRTSMGDRTVIEKFHKKNEKYLFREKLIVLFWDFFFNVFLFFFLFYYAIRAILLLLCIWISQFPMHSTRSWFREVISTMNKKSMQTAFILQRRPEVFGTCPLFFKNKYGLLLSAATSYGRESENQVRKWKGPSPFVLI